MEEVASADGHELLSTEAFEKGHSHSNWLCKGQRLRDELMSWGSPLCVQHSPTFVVFFQKPHNGFQHELDPAKQNSHQVVYSLHHCPLSQWAGTLTRKLSR